jgi:uroporphyrinogen-III synthase
MSGALAGRRVLITRPREQAQALERLVREAGGEPVCVPAIEILPLADPAAFRALADRLADFDLAIFISRNAVRRALDLLGGLPWPAGLKLATVGQGSRAELEKRGFADVIAPAGAAARSDSEALLALPALAAVRGRRIVIFRGEGGRELLGQELAARGASVEHAVCYRRVVPDAAAMRSAWARGMDAVTVSSAEGLANLFAMLGEDAARWLSGMPLFVPHPRVAAEAQRRGLERVIVAGPGDAEMAAALVAHFGAAR